MCLLVCSWDRHVAFTSPPLHSIQLFISYDSTPGRYICQFSWYPTCHNPDALWTPSRYLLQGVIVSQSLWRRPYQVHGKDHNHDMASFNKLQPGALLHPLLDIESVTISPSKAVPSVSYGGGRFVQIRSLEPAAGYYQTSHLITWAVFRRRTHINHTRET